MQVYAIIGAVLLALFAGGYGYHTYTVNSLEKTVKTLTENNATLKGNVATIQKANETLVDSIDRIQQQAEQIANLAEETSVRNEELQTQLDAARSQLTSEQARQELENSFTTAPDAAVDSVNTQINCILNNLGSADSCKTKVTGGTK